MQLETLCPATHLHVQYLGPTLLRENAHHFSAFELARPDLQPSVAHRQ